jgi:hypothetical protein
MSELHERWTNYRLKVIPLDAPKIQGVECRRAFYHGAECVLEMLQKNLDLPAQQQKAEIEALIAEILIFRQHVTAGRA